MTLRVIYTASRADEGFTIQGQDLLSELGGPDFTTRHISDPTDNDSCKVLLAQVAAETPPQIPFVTSQDIIYVVMGYSTQGAVLSEYYGVSIYGVPAYRDSIAQNSTSLKF